MSPTCNPCFFFNSIDALSVSLRTVTRVVNLILAPTQTKLVRKRKENRKTKKEQRRTKKKNQDCRKFSEYSTQSCIFNRLLNTLSCRETHTSLEKSSLQMNTMLISLYLSGGCFKYIKKSL